MTKPGPVSLALAFVILAALAASGCSLQTEEVSAEVPADGALNLAYTPHAEDIAVANLTAVVMEEAAGYDVTLTETTPREAVNGVATGDYDAYQGIWRPAQDDLLAENEGDLNQLQTWLFGKTRASLAAPSYLGIKGMDEAEGAGVKRAFVLEPEAFALRAVPEEVFEKHGIEPSYYPDMASLWEEAGPLYEREEPLVVLAYAPNWTNLEYELDYIEGEELLYDLNVPHDISSVARPGLGNEDPFAFAMLDGLRLSGPQLEDLETYIQEAGGPRPGSEEWAEDNEALMASWVYIARQRIS